MWDMKFKGLVHMKALSYLDAMVKMARKHGERLKEKI